MTNYTNNTYVDFEKLQEPPNVTLDIELKWNWVNEGIQSVFGKFSFLQVAQSLGIFFVLFVLFYNQKILNLTNMQNVMASSFVVLMFNVLMLYSGYYTSFYMLGTFFVVWLISLITTIRDR